MPSAMTTSGGTANSTSPSQGQAQSPVAIKSFVRSSLEHRESAGIDITRQISSSDQDLGSFAIPAYGYLRSLLVYVTVTAGAGASTFSADAPWNFLKNIIVQEPNGATIAQFNSGYDLYLANKWGGYRGFNDPKAKPDYSTNATGGLATFLLRIPLELRGRDALGSLPNQNAAAAFQLRMTLSSAATVYTSQPATTLPQVRVRVIAEEWDQPAVSSDGAANQTTPPAMNTTQYWSKQVYPVVAGQNTIRLTRVGNYIRGLNFIYRDGTGARVTNASNNWPDPAVLYYDTRPIDNILSAVWRSTMVERAGYSGTIEAVNGLDNGVYPYDFMHEFDGRLGNELNDGWLPTLSSTRLEVQGSFGVAGTLEVLTNDVSVAGNVFL
ncbi:coat protein [Rhodococcus phage Toil]|uniref:Coat protein n=1 Tax=Rhodococcus phage Toil TaxID=1975614 RepID=A0A1W6DXH0_9VIRU|nr:coat protein [Rhodococcus phage Toil]ARK07697.1 coat protein [Rhodococcus phage Toil]